MEVTCKFCGSRLDETLINCPNCGSALPKAPGPSLPLRLWKAVLEDRRKRIAAVCLLAVLCFWVSFAVLSALLGRLRGPEAAVGTTSSYEELMRVTPVDVFPPGSIHTLALEEIFDRSIYSITWDEVARIKYIGGSESGSFTYSFHNSWEFDSGEAFQATVKTLRLPGDAAGYNGGELGYFVGAEEMNISATARRVYGYELASVPNLKSLEAVVDADYEEFKDLKTLEHLGVHGSNGGSLRYLSNLTSLKSLSLDNTDYQSLAELSRLFKLETLVLGNNKYPWDVQSIGELKSLHHLELKATGIKSLSALDGLEGLETLSLSDLSVSELRVLSRLPALTRLDLTVAARVGDLSHLRNVPLQSLSLDVTNLAQYAWLGSMDTLEELSITGGANLSFLGQLGGLKRLTLIHSDYGTTFQYSELSGLEYLELRNIVLPDDASGEPLEQFASLQSLHSLRVESCYFTVGVDDLFTPPNLRELALVNSYVPFYPASFAQLEGLERLDLSQTTGLDQALSHLPDMPRLTYLNLEQCRLESCGFLSGMPNLEYVNLQGNRIEELEELERLSHLETAYVGGNPLKDRGVLQRLSPTVQIVE